MLVFWILRADQGGLWAPYARAWAPGMDHLYAQRDAKPEVNGRGSRSDPAARSTRCGKPSIRRGMSPAGLSTRRATNLVRPSDEVRRRVVGERLTRTARWSTASDDGPGPRRCRRVYQAPSPSARARRGAPGPDRPGTVTDALRNRRLPSGSATRIGAHRRRRIVSEEITHRSGPRRRLARPYEKRSRLARSRRPRVLDASTGCLLP